MRRTVLLVTSLVAIAAGLLGAGLEKHLSNGGYTSDSFASVRADRVLADRFRAGAPNLVLVVRADGDLAHGSPADAGRALVRRVAQSPGVVFAQSPWTTADPALRAPDGRTVAA
ncbi:hypothetical protein ACLB9X_08885 [Streptomyces sp. 5K101]|uniref:hypothetical protein n=1 Tax=Streptomyces sp. 5K101 TaxID=3390037 RepID=UPI003976AE1E